MAEGLSEAAKAAARAKALEIAQRLSSRLPGGGGIVQHHGAQLAPGAPGHVALGFPNMMTGGGSFGGGASGGHDHGTKRGRDPEPDPWPDQRKRPTAAGFNTAAPLALPDSLYGDDGKGSALRMSAGGSSIELRVPADRVGLIIGRGGETIKRLQDTTGAHIQVGKEAEGVDRTVMVEGTPQQVATAKEEIMQIINDRPGGGGGPRRPGLGAPGGGHYGPSGGIDNSNSEVLKVPSANVGLIIGKGGETIKQLQNETGCRIQVARDDTVAPGAVEREVTLYGRPDQIEECQRRIRVLLGGRLEAMQNQQGGGGGGHGGGVIIMKVPNAQVGIVIGRGGETIKMLQQKTGCRIQVSKDEGQAMRDITLTGGPREQDLAQKEILILAGQSRAAQDGGGDRRGGGGGGPRGGGGGGGGGDPYGGGQGMYGGQPGYGMQQPGMYPPYGGYDPYAGYYGQQQGGYPGYPPQGGQPYPGQPGGAPGGPPQGGAPGSDANGNGAPPSAAGGSAMNPSQAAAVAAAATPTSAEVAAMTPEQQAKAYNDYYANYYAQFGYGWDPVTQQPIPGAGGAPAAATGGAAPPSAASNGSAAPPSNGATAAPPAAAGDSDAPPPLPSSNDDSGAPGS